MINYYCFLYANYEYLIMIFCCKNSSYPTSMAESIEGHNGWTGDLLPCYNWNPAIS